MLQLAYGNVVVGLGRDNEMLIVGCCHHSTYIVRFSQHSTDALHYSTQCPTESCADCADLVVK